MTDDLINLAERVEALTGPDREVDAEIALTLSIVRERDGDLFYGHRNYSVMVIERHYDDREGDAPELPHYTTSIDAAMTLVPEGCLWTMDSFNGPKWSAGVWRVPGRGWVYLSKNLRAATPALALTAAALRARGAEQ